MADLVLQIDNVRSRLVTNDLKLKTQLSNLLRFRPPNFWANKAFVEKRWDGWDYFFDAKSGTFLTGLLPEIKIFLNKRNRSFVEIDQRPKIQWLHESIGDNFLADCTPPGVDEITLHDFQPDLVNMCIKHNRGIVAAPTGAGKTLILISILKCLPPKTPVLFLTKNSGLVDQNYEEMKLWGIPHLGRWYNKYKEPNYVMCATSHFKTFESLAKLLPKFQVLIVDEVHEVMSKVPVAAYKKMKNAGVRIGISATAFKWHKKDIEDVHKWEVKSHFGPIFRTKTTKTGVLTTKDLQDRKILSSSECFIYKVTHPSIPYEPFQNAIELGIEQNFHFHEMVSKLAKSCPGRTLIVVERIAQGEYLKQLIPGSHFIQGKTTLKERRPILKALKTADKVVAIVMRPIITAGINVKVHDLINASGGESAHNVIQLIGRGLRTATDKEKLRYHDFLFLINDYLKDDSEWRIEVLKKEGHSVVIKEGLGMP